MAESTLVINNRELKYKGIFRSEELFQIINKVLEERGYTKSEKRSEELNTPEGRQFYVELRPAKVKTSYLKLEMRIRITLDGITSVVEEKDGRKSRYDVGSVKIIFDGWLRTDYQERWSQNPYIFFLKGWINKYIYRFKLDSSYASEIFTDTAYIYGQLRSLLDSYVPKEKKKYSEIKVTEDMKKQIEGSI